VNWNPEDPLFKELFRFSWFLHVSRAAAMQALEKAFHRLSGKPEAAERERAARFLFMQLRRGAPKPGKAATSIGLDAPPPLEKLRNLPEPERSLAGLFYATSLSAADISRILGHPQQDLSRRLCLLRKRVQPADNRVNEKTACKPSANELLSAFERPKNNESDEFCDESVSLQEETVWLSEFSKISPNQEESAILTDWANHLKVRASSWRPSPRDPAMIGLACALIFLVGIVIWAVLGSPETFHGRAKVIAILEEGVGAPASDYEPVSGTLGDLGDWLALQGFEGISPPPGFAAQRMVAARIFSFEGTRVATILMPDSEMVAFVFDAEAIDVTIKPVGQWKFFSRGQDSAAIIQLGRNAFMAAIRGSPEDLQRQLDAITAM
jgi:hypothetical protein